MSEEEFERRQPSGEANPAAFSTAEPEPAPKASTTRTRSSRGKAAKPRRVQRMFAIEEELDKKLWLYAIHVGKDRSEVVNDLLRPLVASMVLYDSRDRRSSSRASEPQQQDEQGGETDDNGS